MIRGVVNSDMEAMIQLELRDAHGKAHVIDAAIDTGFNGFLTLAPSLIAKLGLPWICRQDGMLADGSIQVFDVHTAAVEWDGETRTVEADAAEGVPLVGMRLMLGYRLGLEIKDAGDVFLTEMS